MTHRVDGGLVGALLVAPTDHPGGGQRRGLGHPDQLEGQVAVDPDVLVPQAHGSPGGLRAPALSLARNTEPTRISSPPANPIHQP